MTTLGEIFLFGAATLTVLWILDLVRRGRLYVGYGVVMLGLVGLVAGVAIIPFARELGAGFLYRLFPVEPVAAMGLAAVLLLLVYVLHQLSVLSDRVATLTQELAIRIPRKAQARDQAPDGHREGP